MTLRKNWMRPVFVLVVILLLRFFTSVPVRAQVVGATLSGTVADSSGAVIASAKISIRNVATGAGRDVAADSSGFYNVTNLQPGSYEVTVSAPGFAPYEQKGLTLAVGVHQVLNIPMKVGQVSQTVEVSTDAPVVDLASSSISNQIDSNTVRELPLNGRDWTQLATLSPGVHAINTQSSVESKSSRSRRGWGNQLTDAGHRPTENNFVVDGISVNDPSNSGPGSVLGVNLGADAIQEFSVVTTNYSADYGRTSGAYINAITKSGTNAFHGDAYGFFRNAALDAQPFFTLAGSTQPPFSRKQFGASAGYKIQKDKTFIFGDYEGIRQSLSTPNQNVVLSPGAHNGFLVNGGPAVASCSAAATPQHPAGTTDVDPGISNVCVDNLVLPYLQFYPAASCPAGGCDDTGVYNVLGQSTLTENYFTIKVDHKFSEKDSMSSSYFYDFAPFTTTDSFAYTTIGTITHRQVFSLAEYHVFSPSLVNSARAGVSRVWSANQSPLTALNPLAADTKYGATPGQSVPIIEIPGVLTAMQGGFGASGENIIGWTSWQFYDDLSLTKGTHALKFGFAFERMEKNDGSGPFENGDFVFGTIQDFLTNQPQNVSLFDPTHSVTFGVRQSLFAGYAQDDWRVRSNLTVNLGLRYEMSTLPTEPQGRFQFVRDFFNGVPVPVSTSWVGNSTLRDFAPRVGLAWDPFKNGKTSVRAGFGIFDVVPLPVVSAPGPGFPFSIQPTINLLAHPGTFPKGANALLNFTGVDNTTTVSYKEPNPKRSYDMNWNFNVERDLGHNTSILIGYTGMRAVHQVVHPQDPNGVPGHFAPGAGWLWPIPGADPVATGTGGFCADQVTTPPCPWPVNNPNVGDIRSTIWSGSAFYNGLQGQFKKALSHGLEGQVAYTWGHCIDDGSSGAISDQFQNSLSTFFWMYPDIRADHRANCDYDQRHVLSVNFIWMIPSPTGNAFARNILGGWQAGGILTAQTGTPFTVLIGGDSLGFSSTDVHNYPDRLSTAGCNNPVNPGNTANYLKLDCFSVPIAPTSFTSQCVSAVTGVAGPVANTITCMNLLGNNGRNSIFGPGLLDLDFSLFKNIPVKKISEAFNIQFRTEFFNIMNHPSFQSPLDTIALFGPDGAANSGAGQLDATTTTQRQIQFGVKIVW
jgi:hypothetical protein